MFQIVRMRGILQRRRRWKTIDLKNILVLAKIFSKINIVLNILFYESKAQFLA